MHEFTEEQKKEVMKTYRSTGAIGKNAIVPRYLYENFLSSCRNQKITWRILDYGCGKDMIHVKFLRDQGFTYTYGYDFSIPASRGICIQDFFDIVYASNVLNVQTSISMIESILDDISMLLKPQGLFIANYPKTPRKLAINEYYIYDELLSRFFRNKTMNKNKGPLFICRK